MSADLIGVGTLAFLTSFISSITGAAGGVLLLSGLSFLLPASALIPLHGTVQSWSCGNRLFLYRSHIAWKVVKPFLLLMVPGTILGGLCLKVVAKFNPSILLVMVGLVILSTALNLGRTAPMQAVSSRSELRFSLLGLGCGFLSVLAGSTGPLVSSALLKEGIIKEQHIATKSLMQGASHLLKIPIFVYFVQFPFEQYLPELASMLSCVVIGSWLGKQCLKHLSSEHFSAILRGLLFIAALKLLFTELPKLF